MCDIMVMHWIRVSSCSEMCLRGGGMTRHCRRWLDSPAKFVSKYSHLHSNDLNRLVSKCTDFSMTSILVSFQYDKESG